MTPCAIAIIGYTVFCGALFTYLLRNAPEYHDD